MSASATTAGPRTRRPGRPATRPVLALAALAALALGCEPPPPVTEVPLAALHPQLVTSKPVALTARGLEVDVDGWVAIDLPFPARELELVLEADGPMILTWASSPPNEPERAQVYGPPWRYRAIPRVPTALRLDLVRTAGWSWSSDPVLVLDGIGHVVVHAVRVARPGGTLDETLRMSDRDRLLAPESVGHTTINLLTPSFWRASRGDWLADRVAALAAAVFVCVLVAGRLVRGRARSAAALAAAALVATALWDAHFLWRLLPALDLRPTPDRERRIRENYYFTPAVGQLAALAREQVRPGERVGVVGREKDWFGPQTLCFNLAPRPCVIVGKERAVHRGISRVGALRTDELDAIVVYHGEWIPPGFTRVAGFGPGAWIGRRDR